MMLRSALGLVLLLAAPAAGAQPPKVQTISAVELYRGDCYLKVNSTNPGAGTDPKSITPFESVLKDGYYMVDCVKDEMFYKGDKFGDHKHAYEIGQSSGVSIVHYDAHVAREDQKEMTHEVCFDFCRTIPDMNFFGLQNGRSCYCEPYYKMEAGDSSQCTAVCPGDASAMCGGTSKSSIFQMHSCNDMAKVFSDTASETGTAAGDLKGFAEKVKGAATDMTTAADGFQKAFGAAGDPAASDLMQSAKVFAGEMQHEAEAAEALSAANEKVSAETVSDFKSFEGADKAEGLIAKMEAGLKEMEASHEALTKTHAKATPYEDLKEPATAGAQYYSAMYFVDKAHVDVPSTCSGKSVGEPIFSQSFDECAMACDADVHDCVGFSFFKGQQAANMCFLFSKFSTATYYTGCANGEPQKKQAFLQKKQAANGDATMCFAKLAAFEGTTLKPNPSGKCEQCFKKVTAADRCFE